MQLERAESVIYFLDILAALHPLHAPKPRADWLPLEMLCRLYSVNITISRASLAQSYTYL